MAFGKRKKSRAGIYDKVIKQAVSVLRQELAPLATSQQAILVQTEKINENVRKIMASVGPRDESDQG